MKRGLQSIELLIGDKLQVLLNGLRSQLAYDHLFSRANRVWSLIQYNKTLGFEER
jgi:hypothetical protein